VSSTVRGRWTDTPVDWRQGVGLVGRVVKYLAAPLVVPLLVALYYGERDAVTFLLAIVLTLLLGAALERVEPDSELDLGLREGLLVVSATWILVSVVGAVPYLISAHGVPGLFAPTSPASTLGAPINALFESTSGFTTTGATVMGDISFDTHSRSMMLWRQLTQWLGGMGIVVLAIAILPELRVGGAQLMDAEAPGVNLEKLTPRIAQTARVLWLIYLGFTLAEMVLLYGLHLVGAAPEMTLYNAVAHALTTMPTGGFSPAADSIAAFSAAVQWLVIPFMVAAGANFALFWHAVTGSPERLRENTEFRAYLGVMGVIAAVLAGLLFAGGSPALGDLGGVTAGNAENALRQAAFQAVSIVTTTGFATSDFAQWGQPLKQVVLAAMFVGGSAGSTGSAVKIVRWVVIAKSIRRELFTTVHPDAVRPVRLAGTVIDERTIRDVYGFTLLYLGIFAVATVLISVDVSRIGHYSIDALEAMSSVAATLGNVGPGFGSLGPFGSYLEFPRPSKLLMVVLMLIGRLEIFPLLVLFTRSFWRS
jgi:trk system potassium uptake protein TrkH